MAQILLDIQQRWPELRINYFQSNHEGDLIDWIQLINDGMLRTDVLNDEPTALNDVQGNVLNDEPTALNDVLGIVLNAGGYSHTSVALRDAVEEAEVPVVEVHISDIRTREPFRRESLLTDVCAHSIIGHGVDGYSEAIEWLLHNGERRMAKG